MLILKFLRLNKPIQRGEKFSFCAVFVFYEKNVKYTKFDKNTTKFDRGKMEYENNDILESKKIEGKEVV